MTLASQRAPERLPIWYVTSSHGTRIANPSGPAQWQPYGLHHARQAGSIVTACGLWAAEWQIFWDLAFPSAPGQTTCRMCLHRVATSPAR
jgi:hypothetical protein